MAREEPERVPNYKILERLKTIRNASSRLLNQLGLPPKRLAEAPDGPPDADLAAALAVQLHGEHDIAGLTGRLGRFQEILDGIEAARQFHKLATEASEEYSKVDAFSGFKGDIASANWAADMRCAYKVATGNQPSPGSPRVPGPFIRFLMTAGEPLGIERKWQHWRDLVVYQEKMAKKKSDFPTRKC